MRFLRIHYKDEPIIWPEVSKNWKSEEDSSWITEGGPRSGRVLPRCNHVELQNLDCTHIDVPIQTAQIADVIVCGDRVLKSRW